MRFEIILAPQAVEDRSRLRAFDRAAVDEAMELHLRHEPGKVSKSRIKRLRGLRRPQYRLRVNDLRVFYDVAGKEVQVLGIVLKADAEDWLKATGESQ
jgi:mRNA-degrading endonuclease RelE of RelBE toxin-antitoxin system